MITMYGRIYFTSCYNLRSSREKISIKFFLSCFLVRNLDSKKIMLYSLVEHHLYKLYPRKFLEKNQISSSLMLHLAATSNFDIWHNRFGHLHVILSKSSKSFQSFFLILFSWKCWCRAY